MNKSVESVEKWIFDVNILAIFLSRGHPGFEYVSEVVEAGLQGAYMPVIMDFLPLRAFWVMTRRWGLPEKECSAAVEHFVRTYDAPQYSALKREAVLDGFRLARELNHDVFDCVYLALAFQEKATSVVTTDTDFEKLCKLADLKYVNPVPREILKRFRDENK